MCLQRLLPSRVVINCKRYFTRKMSSVPITLNEFNVVRWPADSFKSLQMRNPNNWVHTNMPLTWMANMASSEVCAPNASFAMGIQASPKVASHSSGNGVHQVHSCRVHHLRQVHHSHRHRRGRCRYGPACYCLLTYFVPSVVDARPALGPICGEREEGSMWKTNLINIYLRA